MKRNVVSLLSFLLIGLAVSAQTEKGNWLVGGNLRLNTASQNTNIGINPSAGYFFLPNFAAGANVNFNYSKIGNNKATTFGVGPFARYYFGTLNVRPLLETSVNFLSSKVKNSGVSVSATETGTEFFFGGGLAGFINRNVALEGLAGYNHISVNGGSGGFSLRVGFQVYLSKAQVESLRTNM